MMERVLVTGCAGFIGSSLCERLLSEGYQVIGVDSFTPNYDRAIKQQNMKNLLNHPHFQFTRGDVTALDLKALVKNTDAVFHQAAMPGVRSSWGQDFLIYVHNNVLATQALLEAVKDQPIRKFVYASSSSVYGEMNGPTGELQMPKPLSPYGVTKLSGEHLCHLYHKSFDVPVVSLRYFTVFGPRQRPDMAFHKFILNALLEKPVTIFGDGTQTRDFTYIDDAVEANLLALTCGKNGEVYNIGGNNRVSVRQVTTMISELTGKPLKLNYIDEQPGDPKHTWADINKAKQLLNYSPSCRLEQGLIEQVRYIRGLYQL